MTALRRSDHEADCQLTPLEIAVGMALEDPRARPARRPPPSPPPRQVLEEVILAGLQTGRSSVSFSGGRDSSLVLAVATHVARREGLPLPVPVTIRHPSPASQESEWQEVVVSHLGLDDWERVDVGTSLEIFGKDSRTVLDSCGLLSPPNAYLHLTLCRAAPPGTLFTGAGGDELFGTRAWRLASVLAGRLTPRPSDLVRLAFAAAPGTARRRVQRRREHSVEFAWLTPAARHHARDVMAAEEVRTRLRWDVLAQTFARSRSVQLSGAATNAVGSLTDVTISNPLLSTPFISALAHRAGLAGPPGRSEVMHQLAADILPTELLGRRGKAAFGAVIWGPTMRSFVEQWDPDTLNPGVRALIDIEALALEWTAPEPSYHTMLLAQCAWLDQHRPSAP